MGSIRIPDLVPSPTQDRMVTSCDAILYGIELLAGWGTDEKAVIWVLGHRNADQRKKIRDTYQHLYNESLIDRLHSELSGDFRNAVILWTLDPAERDAKLIREALDVKKNKKKSSVKELQVIVETACTTSPHHLIAVRQSYCSLFDCSLEEDISSYVNLPSLRKLLLGLVSSYRYDGEMVDGNVAKLEAAKLRDAIEKKQLDHDDVVLILSTRNIFQLKATFECYRLDYMNPIDQDIKSCGTGDLESILQMVVQCIEAPEKHFAEVVRDSIVGLGTDEDSLTRAIVSRAEIDMMKIRGVYFDTYKSSLDNAVVDDTSGDYKDFLMTLLGAKI
ncbi:Annexin [Macleaya cordata]|uniref:Annexin n=1 Tax=Macleaya cordata TaxID=56857 RepID=A0A200QTG3_MACCD|nr:Annexin [Macleaya cordata]